MSSDSRLFFDNISKLFTAFSFFKIKNRDIKYFQFIYPSIISFIIISLYFLLSKKYFDVKLTSISSNITSLMGVLIGFYIAALAAVTSFPNQSLNNIMRGDTPKIKYHNSKDYELLSRRRFLSIILGYCAFISIIIYIIGSINSAVDINIDNIKIKITLVFVFWCIYTWVISSLLVVTMLCLHYLIDRMHRE